MTPEGPSLLGLSMDVQQSHFSLSGPEMISGCGFPDIFLTSFLKSHIKALGEVLARYPLLGFHSP